MSIEKAISDLTAAINANTAAIQESSALIQGGGSAKNTTSDKKADTDSKVADAKVDSQPKVTEAQLTAKIKEVAKATDKDKAREQFSDLGYEKMAEIKPEHYDKVYDRCVEVLAGDNDDI